VELSSLECPWPDDWAVVPVGSELPPPQLSKLPQKSPKIQNHATKDHVFIENSPTMAKIV
jgi:hypothetical protein